MLEESNYWKQALSRRINRRGILGAGAAGIAVLAAACGGGNTSQQARQETGQPKYGGRITLTMGEPPHLDPHTETMHAGYMTALVYNGLVRFDPTDDPAVMKVVGDLAESWDISPDGNTYTFKLRKGVKFHNKPPVNGREVTADDVKFSIERIRTDKAEFQRRSFFTAIDGIEAVDKYTVKIVTKMPFAPLLTYLADTWNAIVPKEVVERDGDLRKTAIGTGPFTLESWEVGIGMILKKNPDFFIQGRPYLDEIKLMVVLDTATGVSGFLGKQIDVRAIPDNDLESVKKSNPDITVAEYPRQGYEYVRLNNAKKPFDDVRVRRAISLSIDRQAIIDTLYQGRGKISGPIPWGVTEWALPPEQFQYIKYDPDQAKKLLAEAGYPNGFKVTGTFSATDVDRPTLVQQMFKKVGIELEQKRMEYGAYLQSQYSKDYDLAIHYGNRYDDIDGFLMEYHTKGARNFGSWGSPDLDVLIDKQRGIMDKTERKKAVDEILKILGDQLWTAPVPNKIDNVCVQPWIKNWHASVHWFNPTRWAAYYVWLEK